MKKYSLLFFIISLILVSCNPDEPQFTPQMYFSPFEVYHADSLHTKDTLKLRMIDDKYVFDTISVGDTVRYSLICDAVVNQLTSFEAQPDENIVELSLTLTDEQLSVIESSSEVDKCKLKFKAGYSGFGFPMQYIATKSGSVIITLTLSSTSKFSPSVVSFRQPIE